MSKSDLANLTVEQNNILISAEKTRVELNFQDLILIDIQEYNHPDRMKFDFEAFRKSDEYRKTLAEANTKLFEYSDPNLENVVEINLSTPEISFQFISKRNQAD